MAEVNYFSVVESTHDIQNPTSPDKLRLVADYLGASAGDRALDIGSGRGWWAVELARNGLDVLGLEINEDFTAAAEQRAERAGVADLVRTITGPAEEFEPEEGGFDVVTCLGASFALGGYREALAWMARAVRDGGRIAIGEVHANEHPSSGELPSLLELVHVAEDIGFEVIGLVSAGIDDWDRYESQHWRNVHDWARRHPDHPDRAEVLASSRGFRTDYLAHERGQLGWSVLVATDSRW